MSEARPVTVTGLIDAAIEEIRMIGFAANGVDPFATSALRARGAMALIELVAEARILEMPSVQELTRYTMEQLGTPTP